jgi:cytoskeletal protein RodZ
MRLLIAGMAALAAVAFAAPSLAQQEDPPAAPAPVPTAKPKPGTAAYCQSLKSSSSRSSCMKKLHAQATPKAAPTTKKTRKSTTTPAAPKQPDVGQLAPPASTAAPAPTSGTVAVPPLPQKTI